MDRDYEIYEVLPDGSVVRIARVHGLEFALVRLRELAKHTSRECFAADAKTRQVVGQMNVPSAKRRTTKQIFQIAYDEEAGTRRAEVLRRLGYGVISVIGNQA